MPVETRTYTPSEATQEASRPPFATSPAHTYSGESYVPDGHPLPGDLAWRDAAVVSGIMTHIIGKYSDAVAAYKGNNGSLPPGLDDLKAQNPRAIDAFREHVANPNNYEPGAAETIRNRYQNADARSVGMSDFDRIAYRLATASTLDGQLEATFVTDVDGTLTGNNPEETYLNELVPGGPVAEPLLKQKNHGQLWDVFVETRHPFVEQGGDIFRKVGATPEIVPLRPGVNEFFAGIHGIKAEYHAVSASFKPFVDGVLDQASASKDCIRWGVTPEHAISTDKSTVITHLALLDPNQGLFFFGDGSSDASAIDVYDITTGIFAVRGSKFDALLTERKIPHLTFNDFNELNDTLQKLASRTQEIAHAI